MHAAIITQSLTKRYGSLTALEDFDLTVAQGSIFGLLGPNGAGKTTLIRILTTLMRQTSGTALIQGLDIRCQGREIRRLIGVVPQENSLDRYLTARENLELHARLHGMEARLYRQRIDELLELMGLANRQKDFPDTYSGGMQRRLVVARALVHQPQVLFLDEPTTGLDPQSRRAVWEYIRSIAGSMTIFLTTHYLEEAEQLCDRIAIMDHGRLIVQGTTQELKERLTGDTVYEIEFGEEGDRYRDLLRGMACVRGVSAVGRTVQVALESWECLSEVVTALNGAPLRRISLRERTLEDVFISLTGAGVRE
ncbi:ATP-binding cassette domain-containing protein [Geobacter sp. SVR]|uniref:ABC transporter ATP-binding protein n=1 Tax=Geobacter sp. SVR TaxID=2495594 RepID=UPI00143F00D8|nr:ATP-binding cassette domain-containing protein [Geobacter sp. SVR]BCS54369.1 daunorubicin resistance protein DrrA family ABC transporter ATP-binding protein [Geobacter sp. SVR]GCF87462.1 daunorubicin resistance protein DrrA family ABC transporter ATP-binding protein [Geobacter sp. SVR]